VLQRFHRQDSCNIKRILYTESSTANKRAKAASSSKHLGTKNVEVGKGDRTRAGAGRKWERLLHTMIDPGGPSHTPASQTRLVIRL